MHDLGTPAHGLFEAQSTIAALRARRGGGIVTSLLACALETNAVTDALVVSSDTQRPWARPKIARTREEVLASAGSKYVLVPYGTLPNSLTHDSAIVGLPCQLELNQSCPGLKIGLFCGLAISRRGILYLLRKLSIQPSEIKSLDYRAEGGGLQVELRDGRKIRYPSYFWLSYFFSYHRCLRCRDFSARFADVAVGDRRPEWSTVIVRTKRGNDLFEDAVRQGYVRARTIGYQEFLEKVQSPFFVKELGEGYQATPLVRVRGRWMESLPLWILKKAGRLIYRHSLAHRKHQVE